MPEPEGAAQILGFAGSVAALFAAFDGIGAWWDAVNVSTVPAAISDLIFAALFVMALGLIGARRSTESRRVAGRFLFIAAVASALIAFIDFVFVTEAYGVRPVGGLLVVSAARWSFAAWLCLR